MTRFAPLCLLLLFSCGTSDRNPARSAGAAAGEPGATTASPARTSIKYARGFTIGYFDGYKEVKIPDHTAGAADTLDYLLLPKGAPVPAGHANARVIRIPVQTMVVMGAPQVAEAEFAGVADRIAGVGDGKFIADPLVRNGLRSGRVRQVGLEASLNEELLISLRPGIVITMTNPDAAAGQYRTLHDAGIPVLSDADWLETTPLGKAEWVKLIGALTDREEYVNRKFDSIREIYLHLAAIGRAAPTKPSVIVEMPFKGTWYLPAGGSYMAVLLRDAGASYHWSDTKGVGSLALSFETAAPEALKADFWLNIGDVQSKKDILAQDKRYGDFHAFRTGALYDYNKRVDEPGTNDYWESGVVNPQQVLADLIRILHPGLLPADTLVYYKQLK